MRKSPRLLKRGEPPLQAKRASLPREKENFCSISRRGLGCGIGGAGGRALVGGKCGFCCGGDCLCVDGRWVGRGRVRFDV